MPENSQKNDIMVINFADYQLPKFTEKSGKNWVYWGEDNLYPNYINTLTSKSALHNALITTKSSLTAGSGVSFIGADGKKIKSSVQAKLDKFAASVNPTESLHDVIKKLAVDYQNHGGMSLQIIWSKDKKTIAEIYHTDISSIRSGKVNSDTGLPDTFYYSNDWCQLNKKENEPQIIKSFNQNKRDARQLLFVKPYTRGGILYYPIPSYAGAINYIELDWNISKFHLSNITNGLAPSFFINYVGVEPTVEEKRKMYEKFKQNFATAENAGKFIISYSDSKETAPVITPFQVSDLDKQFDSLADKVLKNLIVGHRITAPVLAGIETAGKLGNRDEILNASELFHNTVIRPDQILIETTIDKILAINGFDGVKTKIENVQPVQFTFEANILQNLLTVDEMRQAINYDPLQEGDITVANTLKYPPTAQPTTTTTPNSHL